MIDQTVFLFEGICTLGLWIRKALEYLMGTPSRRVKAVALSVMRAAGIKRFQRRRMLVCGLETGLVIFW